MQSAMKSTDGDVLDAWPWGCSATQTHRISSHIQALPRPVYGAETPMSFPNAREFVPRPQAKTKPMSYSSAVSGTHQEPTSIPPFVSEFIPSSNDPRDLQWWEYHYAGIPIVDTISPDAWSLSPEEWVTTTASATPSYIHRTALASLTPSASTTSSSSSPANTIDTLPRSPSLSPHRDHALPAHAHDGVYAPRALRARSASTASTSTLPELTSTSTSTSDGSSPRLSLVGKPPPELPPTQAYQFNFSFNPGAKAFIPAFPPLVSTSTSASTSTSTPTTRPAVIHSSSTTTLSSTASTSHSGAGSACTSTTSLSGGSLPTSPALPHKLSTTAASTNCPYPPAAGAAAGDGNGRGSVAPPVEITPDQKIIPPPPPPTPPLDILHGDHTSRACPVAQYPPSTPYLRPWGAAFERAIEYCSGRHPYPSASLKGKGPAFLNPELDDVYHADMYEMGMGTDGRGRWGEAETEMQRCAEAVVCMRDWDGRRMKDLAWCVVYAASDASLRPAYSEGKEGSFLSSPKISARTGSPSQDGEMDGENVDADADGGATTETPTHPDVALFTSQLVDAFGRFYGAEMRAEFVGYLREYGRETFVGWWESDSTNSIFRPLLTAPPLIHPPPPMSDEQLREVYEKEQRIEYEKRLWESYAKPPRSEASSKLSSRNEAYETRLQEVYEKQRLIEYDKQQRSEYEKQRRRRERREMETQANVQAALALTRWLARVFMLGSPSLAPATAEFPVYGSIPAEDGAEDDGGAGSAFAEDDDGAVSSVHTGPNPSAALDPIITAAQMLECIDILCTPGPYDLPSDHQLQMSMARAAGLFELVGNTDESVLWSGIAAVLEANSSTEDGDIEEHWLTEEDERYAMERYPIVSKRKRNRYPIGGRDRDPLGGGGWDGREGQRGEERELGDVMDAVLGALGVVGMSFPVPVPEPEPVGASVWVPLEPEGEVEGAW